MLHGASSNGVQETSWNEEFHALVTQMVISESGLDALRDCMKEWDMTKLKALVVDWDANTLATVLDDFPSHKAAALLAESDASTITLLCDLWDVGAVKRCLPARFSCNLPNKSVTLQLFVYTFPCCEGIHDAQEATAPCQNRFPTSLGITPLSASRP
eukprot:5970699-Pyramimonas_sp.AAC.1